MPFISKRSIALKVRTQADKKYKGQLRDAMRDPSLTPERRVELRRLLRQVGQPRVYDANSPPQPGAFQNTLPEPKVEPSRFTASSLGGLKKVQLVALAEDAGLPTSGTKATLVERLLRA